MSATNTSVKSADYPASESRPVSMHAKLEEARRRRAEVLAAGKPANLSAPAGKTASKRASGAAPAPVETHRPLDIAPMPQPHVPEPRVAAPAAPAVARQETPKPPTPSEPAPETPPARAGLLTRLIRSLFLMLAILVAAAALQLRPQPFEPQVHAKAPSGLSGSPSVPTWGPKIASLPDSSLAAVTPAAIPTASADDSPAVPDPWPVTTEAPAIFVADITLPPPPRPASLVTRSANP